MQSTRARKLARKRDRHKAKGQCVDCRQVSVPGRTMCQRHLDMYKQKAAERYHWLKSVGFCVKCGSAEAVKNIRFCAPCAEKHRTKERTARANAKLLREVLAA